MLSLPKVFFQVSAKSWIYIAESVGTSGRQTWSRFTSTIHGLASPLLLLLFSLYLLSYKRCALSFNCDEYLIPLYFLFFLWFQCTSNLEKCFFLSFLVFLILLLNKFTPPLKEYTNWKLICQMLITHITN